MKHDMKLISTRANAWATLRDRLSRVMHTNIQTTIYEDVNRATLNGHHSLILYNFKIALYS